jgi:Rps23 Pro-64 3,4-dihydroxylase Tpa1-like proline 4-hydroxylase
MHEIAGLLNMRNKDFFVGLLENKLSECRDQVVSQWRNPEQTATRHFVIDGLLPDEICRKIYEAFPRDGNGFFDRESFREKKRTSANLDSYDPILSDITYAFQDPRIVRHVSELLGFRDIEPDPQLYAGGLSMMFQGDFLNPHIDNSHDAERQRYRRLNLLYYVSPDWRVENGGNFELWDDKRTIPKTLTSRFNRLVVMETNKSSWHSVSPVVAKMPRCCVSNYYFSAVSPDATEYFHVTSFSGRPGESLKSVVGVVDNAVRNAVSKAFKVGRGKNLVRKPNDQ